MKPKKFYETFVDRNKLYFRILEGQFKGVEYSYKSLMLDGKLDYKLKNHKTTITEENKLLFEQEIRSILRDKLSKLS